MDPQTVEMARDQFMLTAIGHFLFVVLTLGLVTVLVAIQTVHTVLPRPVTERMLRFWGQIYLLNYALGVVTGIVMELQLGLNWAGLTKATGEVLGVPLALETILAFATEAVFLGLWIFGRDRLPRWLHLGCLLLVAGAAYTSVFSVLVANSFLQVPLGYVTDGGRMRLADPAALLANPALAAVPHVAGAAMLTGGLFLAGVSATQLLRARRHAGVDVAVFRASQRIGLVIAGVAGPVTVATGGAQYAYIGALQPGKEAALGSAAERAAAQAGFAARFGPGDWLPPHGALTAANAVMAGLGVLVTAIAILGLLLSPVAPRVRLVQWVLVPITVVPFALVTAGWLVRELGRAPWAVYGLLPVADGVSPSLTPGRAGVELALFVVLIAVLAIVDWVLMARLVHRFGVLGRPWLLWPAAPVVAADDATTPISVPIARPTVTTGGRS